MRLNALVVAVVVGVAYANDPAPISFNPGEWLGIDGNWSTIKVLLGSNSNILNVLVSTSLSEFWAIGPGGCLNKEPHCTAARGGIYTPLQSKHWSPMGTWQLGLDYMGYGGNGQYGLDTLNAYSPITNIGFGMSNVLISAINTTDYYLGLFGLGITQGNFGHEVAKSPLTQAVETFGWIPSYSYGYTAGASYRNMPVSITLGGSDIARYVPHNTDFTLTQQDNMPRALVRGIEVTASGNGTQPRHWNSATNILSSWNNSFIALIDSTTPYLWLPEEVCDQFAQALNLTYNSTFGLYTLTNDQYNSYTSSDSSTFTFSMSSFDNHDNFGLPLDVPGLINITVPMKAFISLLQYPFMNQVIMYGDPAVPYFSLKKSPSNSSIIIGRSFLQESYIITKYDEAVFSIHQARFPRKPTADARLIPIKQPNNSPYPPPPGPSNGDGKLGIGQMVGIAAGIIILCLACLLSVWYFCRRRKNRHEKAEATLQTKDSASILAPETPRTPISRIFSKISRRKRSPTTVTESEKVMAHPYEAPDSEIYELPAPIAPVELDAGDRGDDGSSFDETVLGTNETQHLSAYDIARRKLDRQLRGPVPEYSPPRNGVLLPPEKAILHDAGPVHSGLLRIDPISIPPIKSSPGTNSLPKTLPSPISPRTDSSSHSGEIPSPITTSVPPGSSSGDSCGHDGPSGSHPISSSSDESREPTHSNTTALQTPSISIQRNPIDPTNIVCVGPLPEQLQSLRQSIMMAYAASRESRSSFTPQFNAKSRPSEQSLGSNYTEEEERVMEEMSRQATLSMIRTNGTEFGTASRLYQSHSMQTQDVGLIQQQPSRVNKVDALKNAERIDGNDLVHIPQLAEKRYSWEDDR